MTINYFDFDEGLCESSRQPGGVLRRLGKRDVLSDQPLGGGSGDWCLSLCFRTRFSPVKRRACARAVSGLYTADLKTSETRNPGTDRSKQTVYAAFCRHICSLVFEINWNPTH